MLFIFAIYVRSFSAVTPSVTPPAKVVTIPMDTDPAMGTAAAQPHDYERFEGDFLKVVPDFLKINPEKGDVKSEAASTELWEGTTIIMVDLSSTVLYSSLDS